MAITLTRHTCSIKYTPKPVTFQAARRLSPAPESGRINRTSFVIIWAENQCMRRTEFHHTLSPFPMTVFARIIALFTLFSLINACISPKNVHFSDAYVQAHKGRFEVYVPEVHELANIVVAISNMGQQDSNMVDMTTAYHQKVLARFLPFKNHPLMQVVNSHLLADDVTNSYWYYYGLKMNACAYDFDENSRIRNKGIIKHMGFGQPKDPIRANLALLQDFAEKSNFRDFYRENTAYYDSLIVNYRALNPADKMQQWLESRFGHQYGNYTVVFSPLVGGAHATRAYRDNGFEQTFMYVCRADYSSLYNQNGNELRQSRVVFTEIDHNFVNPISDKHLDRIQKAFADRPKWVSTSKGDWYRSSDAVFNEYMTWAVFSLYCYDNFPPSDADLAVQKMEKQMVQDRGFIRFHEFNQQLISLYKADKSAPAETWYAGMLDWCDRIKNL